MRLEKIVQKLSKLFRKIPKFQELFRQQSARFLRNIYPCALHEFCFYTNFSKSQFDIIHRMGLILVSKKNAFFTVKNFCENSNLHRMLLGLTVYTTFVKKIAQLEIGVA